MFKHLATRFILMTVLVMVLSSVTSFIFANVFYHAYLKPQNDARITKTLLSQKRFIEAHPEIKAQDFFQEMADLNYQVLTVYDGKKTYFGHPFRIHNLSDENRTGIYHGIKQRPFSLFVTGFFDNETRNTVGTKMTVAGRQYDVYIRPNVGESMGEFRIFLAVLLTLMIMISVLLVFLSSALVVHPVVKLKRVAENIKQGNLSTEVETMRKDELGTLAREMNAMQQSIKRHQQINERFVANVSHEIQSPITNLLGLTSRLKEDDENKELLALIKHQSMRLSNLTKQMLLLSSIENKLQLQKETFSAKALISELVRSFMYQLDSKSMLLKTDVTNDVMTGNRDLLFQMISNLLSNAIKYTDEGGEIKLTVSGGDEQVITIEDNGRGMREETQQHLFERFYKDTAEDGVPSSGLGMAIVKEIADLHDATIDVKSTLNKGTKIIVTLYNNG